MLTPNYNGTIKDPRTSEQKALDYKYEDLAKGDIPLNWIEYKDKNLKSYEIQNQDGSLSCVGQATAKLLAMHEVKEGKGYTRLCPKFIYTRRQNYPEGGMWLPNALEIACKVGTCMEKIIPCDNRGETYMNDKSEPIEAFQDAGNYKGKFYFQITGGIDKIAEVMEQGYGVLLGVRFDYNEWVDVPFLDPESQKKCGHGIAAVDYCLWNGVKALVIEDSWGPGFGKGGRRIITDSFLKARCFYAGYVTSLPNFIFTKNMKMGSTGLDVKMLQQRLSVIIDGIFGLKTKAAVIVFQKSKGLVADGIVGPRTLSELNK